MTKAKGKKGKNKPTAVKTWYYAAISKRA